MQGGEPGPALASARLKGPMKANGDREHSGRARSSSRAEGALWVEAMADQDFFAGQGLRRLRRAGPPPGGRAGRRGGRGCRGAAARPAVALGAFGDHLGDHRHGHLPGRLAAQVEEETTPLQPRLHL